MLHFYISPIINYVGSREVYYDTIWSADCADGVINTTESYLSTQSCTSHITISHISHISHIWDNGNITFQYVEISNLYLTLIAWYCYYNISYITYHVTITNITYHIYFEKSEISCHISRDIRNIMSHISRYHTFYSHISRDIVNLAYQIYHVFVSFITYIGINKYHIISYHIKFYHDSKLTCRIIISHLLSIT